MAGLLAQAQNPENLPPLPGAPPAAPPGVGAEAPPVAPPAAPPGGTPPTAAPADAEAPPPPESGRAPGSTKVTPAEQAAYEKGMNAAGALIYKDDNINGKIMAMIQRKPFEETTAQAGVMITERVDKNLNLPESVLVPMGLDVTQLIAEMGETAGFFKVDQAFEEKTAQLVVRKLLTDYGADHQAMVALGKQADPKHLSSALKQTGEAYGQEMA